MLSRLYQLIASLILLSCMANSAYAVSFACSKAVSYVEKEICADDLIGNLDDALAANYKAMQYSNIGNGAIKNLKATQRAWLALRNKCTTRQCILDAYRKRVDEICDYPVISGIHPGCTYAEDVK
jgi:uncharacterized protein